MKPVDNGMNPQRSAAKMHPSCIYCSSVLLRATAIVAEFERSMILERQQEGIAIAKPLGITKGAKHHSRRPRRASCANVLLAANPSPPSLQNLA
jgi:hypothetical protein